jgi:hypothetical protein
MPFVAMHARKKRIRLAMMMVEPWLTLRKIFREPPDDEPPTTPLITLASAIDEYRQSLGVCRREVTVS